MRSAVFRPRAYKHIQYSTKAQSIATSAMKMRSSHRTNVVLEGLPDKALLKTSPRI